MKFPFFQGGGGSTAEFVPPELLKDEWESPREIAKREERLRSSEVLELETLGGTRETHWAPLRPIATRTPPSTPGFYPVRRVGTTDWSVADVFDGVDGWLYWFTFHTAPIRIRGASTQLYEWGDRPCPMPHR
jgi:hypothetical protein